MKKLFTFFLALAASAGTMFASNTQVDGIWYDFDDSDQTASVTYRGSSYYDLSNDYSGAVVIPASVTYNDETYSVTSIGEYAFHGCDGLTSITIPNSVTSIGGSSFCACTSLTSVTIPNGVTSIGGSAFESCTSLTSVTIPNSVTSIGKNAFCGCAGLTSVDIPNSVDSIGKVAFGDCSSLISINVDSNNQNYCAVDGILFNKTKTTLIQYPGGKQGGYVIPNSVTSIEDLAFYFCAGLTSISIPNSVTSIGNYVFYFCTGLTSVAIPNSVTSTGDYSFVCCSKLTSVTIPNSVTSIGTGAFYRCDGLISIEIPNGVDSIGAGAFAYCTGLGSVTNQATTLPAMGDGVFGEVDCSKILLYVPAKSLDAYKVAEQWKDFGAISSISAKDTETDDVATIATENSVEVAWPQVAGAYTYDIVIKDKSGNVVCTLVFNAQGQLISIAFNAPSRDGAPQHKQDAGFSFVVNGLDSGTEYNYDVIAKDENGNVLDAKSGSFTTQAPQGIDDINAATKSQKIVHEGQILILRGEHIYDIQGKNIK